MGQVQRQEHKALTSGDVALQPGLPQWSHLSGTQRVSSSGWFAVPFYSFSLPDIEGTVGSLAKQASPEYLALQAADSLSDLVSWYKKASLCDISNVSYLF